MSDKDRIIRKIERCLALSESSNEHEAAAALRQANALMEKHQIELSELGLSELSISQDDRIFSTRLPVAWKRMLYIMVAEAFSLSLFWRGGRPIFVGVSPAPTVALYAVDILERQLNKGKKNFMAEVERLNELDNIKMTRSIRTEIGRGYCEGWVFGCMKKVEAFAKSLTNEEKEKHLNKIKSKFGCVEETKSRPPKLAMSSDLGEAAAGAGYREGKNAQLHHGMGQDKKDSRLLANEF